MLNHGLFIYAYILLWHLLLCHVFERCAARWSKQQCSKWQHMSYIKKTCGIMDSFIQHTFSRAVIERWVLTVMKPSSRPESGLGGACSLSMDHFSMMEATWLFSVLRILKPVMFTPLYRYGSTSSANRSWDKTENDFKSQIINNTVITPGKCCRSKFYFNGVAQMLLKK